MDQNEIRLLYEDYGHILYKRCFYILGNEDDAKDVLQEVFIKVIKNINSFRKDSSPLTWMTKISTNSCLNLIKKRKNKQKADIVLKEQEDRNQILRKNNINDKERWSLIRELLDKQNDKVKQIVIYYYLDEMTQEEIGILTGLSLPTIRKNLKLFIKRAQKEILK